MRICGQTIGAITRRNVVNQLAPVINAASPSSLCSCTNAPVIVRVPKAMNVYTWDNMLFTNSKVSDDVVYKLIDTMVKNKDDMLTIQPALREFTAAGLYKKYDIPYHPGALKYFNEHKIDAKSVN